MNSPKTNQSSNIFVLLCVHLGPIERNKIYIHGLSKRISRDQLELHLEERVECEVTDIEYGLDPTLALVTFRAEIGKATVFGVYFLVFYGLRFTSRKFKLRRFVKNKIELGPKMYNVLMRNLFSFLLVFRKKDLYLIITQKLTFHEIQRISYGFHESWQISGEIRQISYRFQG